MRTLILAFVSAAALGAQPFYPDDPLHEVPPLMHVEDVEFRKLNDYYDLFLHTFGEPGELYGFAATAALE